MITSFPSDPQRRNQWLLNIGRPDDTPSNSTRVCSDHFLEKCFIRVSEKSNVRLKKDAVPTRFNSKKLQEITVAQTSSSTVAQISSLTVAQTMQQMIRARK